jgi:hypothetical protein
MRPSRTVRPVVAVDPLQRSLSATVRGVCATRQIKLGWTPAQDLSADLKERFAEYRASARFAQPMTFEKDDEVMAKLRPSSTDSAAAGLYAGTIDTNDPMEKFCATAPDADECRVYED